MPATVGTTRKVWTEAELASLPDDGYIHELVNGELVMSPKNNWFHGDICADLLMAMRSFANTHRLGAVWDSSTGFWMENLNCRAPDISFVRKERLRGLKRREAKFFQGAPDLAVEVLSPSNIRREVDERLSDYFSSGAQLTWVIDPERELVEICHSPTQRRLLGSGAMLDGEQLLPGFQYAIADLFKEWEW